MTVQELLKLTTEELEAMDDASLLKTLGPLVAEARRPDGVEQKNKYIEMLKQAKELIAKLN